MFIHELANWTQFNWNHDKVDAKLAEVSQALGYMHGRLSMIGLDEQLKATAESVTQDIVSSSEIEGVSLNTRSVRSSVARRLGVPYEETNDTLSHYVEGMVSVSLDATRNYKQPITDERLFGWHSELFPSERTSLYHIDVGQYRKSGMQVVTGNMGRERVCYEAPAAERVPAEMEQFIAWFNNPDIPATPLKAAIAHFWFVCIHPFDDGNGRITRALSDMLLARAEDSNLRYYSMSKAIYADRKNYYLELERAQRGDDITNWLLWFLNSLLKAIKESDSIIGNVLNKTTFWHIHEDITCSERQKKILNIYLSGYDGKLTVKNWAKLAGVSMDTANRDIADLVEKKMLRAVQGRVRNIAYNLCYDQHSDLPFENIHIEEKDGQQTICVTYHQQTYCERLTEGDLQGLVQAERTIEDLAYKYFAYLTLL
ncbi:MAG: Fic family protein [Paludibacteraceae bacterium]|nr:Fic family protein [Paludibacteraceae bacterium]